MSNPHCYSVLTDDSKRAVQVRSSCSACITFLFFQMCFKTEGDFLNNGL